MTSSHTQPVENAFVYCPRCGTGNPQPGSIPFRCPNCKFSFYFGPVAAVASLTIDDQDRLLLVRRARDPGKGQWGLPGGFVDRGESAEQALEREVMEETQLVLKHSELFWTGPNRYTYSGVTADVIDLFYVCQVERPDCIELAPNELCEFRWCVPGAEILNNMAFESNRSAVERWLAQRSNLNSTGKKAE